MIYLIGVNHQVQHNRSLHQTQDFISFVHQLINDLRIQVLAEEWNEDANAVSSVLTSVLEDIAYVLNLEYIGCDPTLEERKQLSIRSQQEIQKDLANLSITNYSKEKSLAYQKRLSSEDHPKREQFWYEQLKHNLGKNIIFVCGTEHISEFANSRVDGFDALLKKHDHDYFIMERRFD